MTNKTISTDPDSKMFPPDYTDEEGLLCCGKCRSRKEKRIAWPSMDGSGSSVLRNVTIPCICEQARMDKEDAERKLREHRETVARLQSLCFLSPTSRKQTFANASFSSDDMLKKLKMFADQWNNIKKENSGYLLWGDVGTGKSFAAACIANALLEQEVSVLMRNPGDFMSGSFDERDALCRDVASYDLVIIDDFGMERETDYGKEMTFRIINTRYESGKPIIITTNLSLNDLKTPPDLDHRRVYDRILEMCVPIRFGGENLRGRIHEQKKEIFKELYKNRG